MRRASAVLVTLSLLLAPAAHAQSAAPEFHAGQWAARFGVSGGFYGLGALHFSTPNKAWTLWGQTNGSFTDFTGPNTSQNQQSLGLNVGRRWYRPAASRVRPFGGLGVGGSFDRQHQVSGANTSTSLGYDVNLFGELGATIFFAPELSLGASWNAGVSVGRMSDYLNGTLNGQRTVVEFGGGSIDLEGAFYF